MFKNWKTTVAGLVAGLIGAIATGFTNGAFELNWKSFAAFIVPVIIGLFTKDFDKTGIGANATSDVSKDGTIPTIK